jgi:hypothetical protein
VFTARYGLCLCTHGAVQTTGYRLTLIICNTYRFPRQECLRERVSMLRLYVQPVLYTSVTLKVMQQVMTRSKLWKFSRGEQMSWIFQVTSLRWPPSHSVHLFNRGSSWDIAFCTPSSDIVAVYSILPVLGSSKIVGMCVGKTRFCSTSRAVRSGERGRQNISPNRAVRLPVNKFRSFPVLSANRLGCEPALSGVSS